ncbi:MAG TPA: DUF6093 family protein [Kribbella sp.]
MPLQGARVIPAGWEAHHRPVLETTWTATITFRRHTGEPTFDPATGSTSRASVIVYSGPCRIQDHETNAAGATVAAGERITSHTYRVSLPVEADLALDDIGTVDTANDPTLPGRELLVTDVQRGSLLFQRDLLAVDNLEA